MSFSADRLYNLLPAIHRLRDAEHGNALRDLVAAIAEQVEALEENLDQLYDDQFIETCADWVTPYIGDLIGYRGLHGEVPAVSSPRAEVANTIRFRRRKGTAAMLEQLARDVTGWPARAVEYFQLTGWTQYMNHLRPEALQAPDLRRGVPLGWRDTPFDTMLHTADVRRISGGSGRFNIPNVGIHLWRVQACPLTRSPAVAEPLDPGGRLFRFSPLGNDAQLFARPRTETDITHLAEPFDVPLPLARRWLKANPGAYYGSGRSILLEVTAPAPADPPVAIALSAIRVCDLSDLLDAGGSIVGWAHVPAAGSGKVAIDPVLGRIAFGDAPVGTVLATWHYGFTADIGGGEYERGETDAAGMPLRQVKGGVALQPELDAVQSGGVVEILDSGRYTAGLTVKVAAGASVLLRAANGARPLLAGGDLVADLGPGAALTLDGIVLADGAVRMAAFADKEPRRLLLRHCTLVPGRALRPDGTATQPGQPAIVVRHGFAQVGVSRCLIGAVEVAEDATVDISDSVVDANAPDAEAFRGNGPGTPPGAALTVRRCTVVGKVHCRELTLTEDSLFVARLAAGGETWPAPVWADRRQTGCVRFCYLPPDARTPRRFHCQPDAPHVQPHFTSLRYGMPGYCQLRQATPDSIRRGAHDESEMGVLHDLFQPQREANLRVRLDEYLRFGLEAGIFQQD